MTMSPRDKMLALLAKTPTPTLVTALLTLEASHRSQEERLVRAMTIEELENRFPAASAAVAAAFDADEALLDAGVDTDGVDYVAVLIAAIPTAAVSA